MCSQSRLRGKQGLNLVCNVIELLGRKWHLFPSDCVDKRDHFPNHRLAIKMHGSGDTIAMWSLDLVSVAAEFVQRRQGHP